MSLASFLRGSVLTRTITTEPGGTPDEQRRARLARQRAKEAQGIKDRWPEIPAARLTRSRHWLEDTTNGRLYKEVFGDPAFAGENVCAYYVREDGATVMLKLYATRDEIEKRRTTARMFLTGRRTGTANGEAASSADASFAPSAHLPNGGSTTRCGAAAG